MSENVQERLAEVVDRLDKAYPEAHQELKFDSPFQLLIATILAAQSTDERVNRVTPQLFQKYPDAKSFAEADLPELEQDIRSTGFYRNKAKNIKACCQMLVEKFNGEVPANVDELVQLPGVGRKTANIVLANAMGIPAIGVDTHTLRVPNRNGIVQDVKDPDKMEQALCALLPKERWHRANIVIQWHGRYVCKAKNPECAACVISDLCRWKDKAKFS